MNADRAEWTGIGAALVFHVALIAALSMSLATIKRPPEQPSMEVELVDDVALQSSAPIPVPPAPATAASTAPEPTPPLPLQPPPPQAVAPPAPTPHPQPAVTQRPTAPSPRPAPRTSQLGDDFLKSLDGPQSAKAAAPASPHFDARAKASVAALFQRRVQPCANQQINPGGGANRIRVTVNLRLRPNGTLAGTPQIVRVTGVDDDNARYEERVKDLAVAVYRECSPFSGLPPELYKTPEGGWSNINLTYKLP
jgi:type IV secretory pathway VirB10-like protein